MLLVFPCAHAHPYQENMTYWEPDIEPVPPGHMPARQILNLDKDFIMDPNFKRRDPDKLGRWVPDGHKRKAPRSWSDFHGQPALDVPNPEWEGTFGNISSQVKSKNPAVLPPKAPPPPRHPPPPGSEAKAPPPPPKGPPPTVGKPSPPQVVAVKAASVDIRVGRSDISVMAFPPQKRTPPRGGRR